MEPFSPKRRPKRRRARGDAREATRETRRRTPVVGVAGREAQREQLATIIDDQMQLAAEEPPHRRLPAPCVHAEDLVLLDARRMRAGWQTAREVESLKLMPEHSPSCVCR